MIERSQTMGSYVLRQMQVGGLQNTVRLNDALARAPGVPLPIRTTSSDADQRKCMGPMMTGWQPVSRGVGGAGNIVMGDIAVNLNKYSFPIPGTPALEQRAHPGAGGSTSLETPTRPYERPPEKVVTGGSCGEPTVTKYISVNTYNIVAEFDDDVEGWVTRVLTSVAATAQCVDSAVTALRDQNEIVYPGKYRNYRALMTEVPGQVPADYTCGV